jgi:hypothetical protein
VSVKSGESFPLFHRLLFHNRLLASFRRLFTATLVFSKSVHPQSMLACSLGWSMERRVHRTSLLYVPELMLSEHKILFFVICDVLLRTLRDAQSTRRLLC